MKLYVCPICGNVIYLVEGNSSLLRCCGREMVLLEPNTEDAALEKHVPYCTVEGDKVKVTVGEVVHPMDKDHYIGWIAMKHKNVVTVVWLKPGDSPEAIFDYKKGSVIYAYCNKHGFWKTEI